MKLASINIYVGNQQLKKDVALIKSLNLDVAGYQEAHNATDELDRGLTYTDIFWDDRTKSSREVLVSLNTKRNKLINISGQEVSSVSPKDETTIFKPRSINVVKFTRKSDKKEFALINYHGNAVVQDEKTGLLLDARRVYQWIRAARTIEQRIKSLKEAGFKVLVTGDFNYRRRNTKNFVLHYYSPQKMFKRCGLEFAEHGLDYVAWDKSLRKVDVDIIAKERHGGDHDWVVVELA